MFMALFKLKCGLHSKIQNQASIRGVGIITLKILTCSYKLVSHRLFSVSY